MNITWITLIIIGVVLSPVALFRLAIWLSGFILIPFLLIADGKYRTPRLYKWWCDAENTPAAYTKNRWTMYKWWARNPTPGLIGLIKQPIPEKRPNPDEIVRESILHESAHRFMHSGWFWEYWYLRTMDWKVPSWSPFFKGKHYRWFEVRIGWKFVDGNEEFFPTFQVGPRSS